MGDVIPLRQTYDADIPFLEALETIDQPERVVRLAREVLVARGIPRMSYHFVPPFHSQTGERAVIYQYGYPEAWVELYGDPAFRAADPVPDAVMANHGPLSWRRAFAAARHRPAAAALEAEAARHGLLDGMGVPLFGPGGRDAYSSFELDRPLRPTDRTLLRQFREIAQAAHLRISHLVIQEINEGSQLSMRETEVLSWLVAGKSRTDIATILDLSPATVDTYQRRIFAKLKVNDRLQAALTALSQGLVKL